MLFAVYKKIPIATGHLLHNLTSRVEIVNNEVCPEEQSEGRTEQDRKSGSGLWANSLIHHL